ncbi:hypothetical protein DFH09DRAFT_1304457 [Mycena vulgaris]|nr:hypothetical protein DFH09DRAFT_1304457 [Mycena vulgaris]
MTRRIAETRDRGVAFSPRFSDRARPVSMHDGAIPFCRGDYCSRDRRARAIRQLTRANRPAHPPSPCRPDAPTRRGCLALHRSDPTPALPDSATSQLSPHIHVAPRPQSTSARTTALHVHLPPFRGRRRGHVPRASWASVSVSGRGGARRASRPCSRASAALILLNLVLSLCYILACSPRPPRRRLPPALTQRNNHQHGNGIDGNEAGRRLRPAPPSPAQLSGYRAATSARARAHRQRYEYDHTRARARSPTPPPSALAAPYCALLLSLSPSPPASYTPPLALPLPLPLADPRMCQGTSPRDAAPPLPRSTSPRPPCLSRSRSSAPAPDPLPHSPGRLPSARVWAIRDLELEAQEDDVDDKR